MWRIGALAVSKARLVAVKRRGESAWTKVETEAQRGNAGSYDRAAQLLEDLGTLAKEAGTHPEFLRRLEGIRARHARKPRFIGRLAVIR
jgi:hypothetical protein